MTFPGGVTVQVRPRVSGSTRTERGNEETTYPESARWDLPGVAIAPRYSQEDNTTGLADRVQIGVTLYLEGAAGYDVAIDPKDRIFWDGTEWEIVGRVARWRNPFTNDKDGSQIELVAVTDE